MDKKVVKRSIISYVFLFLVILGVIGIMNFLDTKVNKLSYSEFLTELNNNKVTELVIKQNLKHNLHFLESLILNNKFHFH